MLADVQDVEVELGRELEGLEALRAEKLLADALDAIATRISDVDTRVATDERFARKVTTVQVNFTCRVLRNPNGFRSESEGDYTIAVDQRTASGVRGIMPGEWRDLGLDKRSGYISLDAWRFL